MLKLLSLLFSNVPIPLEKNNSSYLFYEGLNHFISLFTMIPVYFKFWL
jgi:hypothetical protein